MKKSKIRLKDEEVINTFKDIVVVDEEGNTHKVPAIFANQEKTIAYSRLHEIDPEDELKDVKNKVKLPVVSVNRHGAFFSKLYYTLEVYSLYQEDMNQIIEQVILKFKDNKGPIQLHSLHSNESDARGNTSSRVRVCHWTANFSADIDFNED